MLGHVCGIPFHGYQLGSDAMDDTDEPHVDNDTVSLNAAFGL